jgi:hypothetical protein
VAALTTCLSLGGLTLDFVGAGFLAYDVLYGPDARFQASIRRDRLALTRKSRERHERSIGELLESTDASDKERLLRDEISELTDAIDETVAELRHWEKHEHRAQRNALLGLLLLMGGFASQGLATVLSTL